MGETNSYTKTLSYLTMFTFTRIFNNSGHSPLPRCLVISGYLATIGRLAMPRYFIKTGINLKVRVWIYVDVGLYLDVELYLRIWS